MSQTTTVIISPEKVQKEKYLTHLTSTPFILTAELFTVIKNFLISLITLCGCSIGLG